MSGSSLFRKVFDRVFPSMPDFYGLLGEQARQVSDGVGLLVTLMETGDPAVGERIRREEHEADATKARNLHILNESFATPVDREDIHRAIVSLDDIINYCKTTVYEMHELGVGPDEQLVIMSRLLKEGVDILAEGYGALGTSPKEAAAKARLARKAERNVEKVYRAALGKLFEGDDFRNMFRRREIYRHVSNAADRLAACANTLDDIVTKIG